MEPSYPPASHLIPYLDHNKIQIFDCENLSWLSPISIALPPTDSFFDIDDEFYIIFKSMMLSDGRVFLLRYYTSYLGYVVEQSGAVHTYPETNYFLSGGAMVEYDGNVYAFSGSDRENRKDQGARFSLTDYFWQPICKITESRTRFSAVVWHDFIFLCGGLTASNSIDRYDPRTNTMKQLPNIFPEINSTALVFVYGEELIVMSKHILAKYRYQRNTLVQVSSKAFSDEVELNLFALKPVVSRGKVFLPHYRFEDLAGAWYDIETRMLLGYFSIGKR